MFVGLNSEDERIILFSFQTENVASPTDIFSNVIENVASHRDIFSI